MTLEFSQALHAETPLGAVRALADLGPILVVVDPHHPAGSGWPPDVPADALVAVELPDAESAQAVCIDDSIFPWTVVDALGQQHLATVPWAAVVAVVGPLDRIGQPGTGPLIRLWPDHTDPERFGSGDLAEARLQAVLQAAGIGAGEANPQPGSREIEWSIQLSEQELAGDAPRLNWCPDKREALLRILGQAPHAAVVLLRDHSGLTLPGFPRQPVIQIPIGRQPPRLDYALQEDGIALQINQPPDHVGLGFVPWQAVGALQNPSTGQGWYWPADLPEPLHQGLGSSGGEQATLWARAQLLAGLPLSVSPQAAPPARLVRYAPPPSLHKRWLFKGLLRRGPVLALAATRHAGWEVPEGWRSLPVAVLAAGLPEIDAAVLATGQSISLTMPNDLGEATRLHVPWPAIFAIGSATDQEALFSWRDDLPREMVEAMTAISELAAGQETEMPSAHWHPAQGDMQSLPAPFMGIGRTDDGQWVVTVLQPIGPENDLGHRPRIHAVFRLDGVTRLQ